MNSTENRSHQPKGGMCTNCAKWREDCSGLPFETMPGSAKYPNVHTWLREQRFGETVAEAIRHLNFYSSRSPA